MSIEAVEDRLLFDLIKTFPSDKSGFIKKSELAALAKHLGIPRSTIKSKLNSNPYLAYSQTGKGYTLLSTQKANTKNNFITKQRYKKIAVANAKNLDAFYLNELLIHIRNQVDFKSNQKNQINGKKLRKKSTQEQATLTIGLRKILTKSIFGNAVTTNADISKLQRLTVKAERLGYFKMIRGKAGYGTNSGVSNIYVWENTPATMSSSDTKKAKRKKRKEVQSFDAISFVIPQLSYDQVKRIDFNKRTTSDADLAQAFYAKLKEEKQFLLDNGIIKSTFTIRSISNIIKNMIVKGKEEILLSWVNPEHIRFDKLITFGKQIGVDKDEDPIHQSYEVSKFYLKRANR